MHMRLLLALAAVIAAGCTEPIAEQYPPDSKASRAAIRANQGMSEEKRIAALRTDYAKAKKAYGAKKADKTAKQRYVQATVKLGTAVMMAASLPPKQKYPEALRLYREALAIDPKNKEATDNKDMIETIYKRMGRPIPT